MKKIAGAGLLALTLVTGSIGMVPTISALGLGSEQEVQLADSSDYIKFTGVITEVKQTDQSLRVMVVNPENKMQMILPLTDGVPIFNSSTTVKLEKQALKKGIYVEVYYDKNKPVPLIYPATITPEIIVVLGNELGQVKVSKFDEQFLSLDHDLKLNLSEETILLNMKGESIQKDDLKGKELIVFYSFATKSIPAQTTPKKIIALELEDELSWNVEQLIGEDHFVKEGTQMVPLRKAAEQLGYSVEWNQASLSAILRKQNQSFTITIGEKAYGFNRSLRYFDVAPEIVGGRTYVPVQFFNMLTMK